MRFAVIGVFLASITAAQAGPLSFTINNNTVVNESNNTSTSPGGCIGDNFCTKSLTVSQSGSNIVFQYLTTFSGSDTNLSQTVGYADIFFTGANANTGIALGYQNGSINGTPNNSGLSSGFYNVTGYSTSQNIWQNVPNVYYGQSYNNNILSPTVITSGNQIGSIAVSDVNLGNGQYDLTVTLDNAPQSLFANIENGQTDVFWGTGDCANGAFLADNTPQSSDVMEPASMLALMLGFATVVYMNRRSVA